MAFFSFPLPLPDVPFFFTFVTLIASGVLGRGASASKSYAGKRDGSGAAMGAATPAPSGVAERDLLPAPFPYVPYEGEATRAPGRCGCGDAGAGGVRTAPSGISPARSMTNVCAGGAGELRRLGRRAWGAAATAAVQIQYDAVCVQWRKDWDPGVRRVRVGVWR